MQRREEGHVNGYVGDVVSDVLLTSIVVPKLVDYETVRNRGRFLQIKHSIAYPFIKALD